MPATLLLKRVRDGCRRHVHASTTSVDGGPSFMSVRHYPGRVVGRSVREEASRTCHLGHSGCGVLLDFLYWEVCCGGGGWMVVWGLKVKSV